VETPPTAFSGQPSLPAQQLNHSAEIDRHHHNYQRQFHHFVRIPKLALERYRLVPILQYENNREPRLPRVKAGFSARLARAVLPISNNSPLNFLNG
jgi:hypothetical protein